MVPHLFRFVIDRCQESLLLLSLSFFPSPKGLSSVSLSCYARKACQFWNWSLGLASEKRSIVGFFHLSSPMLLLPLCSASNTALLLPSGLPHFSVLSLLSRMIDGYMEYVHSARENPWLVRCSHFICF